MYLSLISLFFISSHTAVSLFPPSSSITISNSYYLLNIDDNLNDTQSSSVICDNLLTEQQTYRIPRQCLTHFYCDSSKCDDQQFRCVKLRESLCCLYKYFTKNCRLNTIKENFRYIYFQLSIQHGYCEINLERIENTDETYCIAEDDFRQLQTTTPFYRHYDYLKPHTKHTYQQHPRVLKTAKHYRRKQHTAARYNHSNNDYYPRKTAFHNLSVSVTSSSYHQTISLPLLFIFSLLLSNN